MYIGRNGEPSAGLAAGGLIHDHNGKWITGFVMNIGSCSVTVAELYELYHNLNKA